KWDNSTVPLANSWTYFTTSDGTGIGPTNMAIDHTDNLYISLVNAGNTSTITVYNFSTTNVLTPASFSLPIANIANNINTDIVKFSSNGNANSWIEIDDAEATWPSSLAIDSKNNLYFSRNVRTSYVVPIYDFSTNNTPGPGTQFSLPNTAIQSSLYLIKWSSTGVATSWTQIFNPT